MSFRLQSDLLCPICHDVFQEPVILGCSHSFCQRCLELHWKQRDDRLCPLCQRRHSKDRLPPNLLVKILSDKVRRARGKSWAPRTICSLHSKTFKLFCLDQQQLACVVCRDSEQHTHHSFRPVDEAAVDQRDALQTALKPLRRRLADVQLAGQKLQRTAEDLEVQARNTERRMKETYEKLRRFLAEDEKERMAALREEEEQKSRMMEEMMETLSRQIQTLSDVIRATEEELRDDDLPFLLNSKAAVERVQQCSMTGEPQLPSGTHIDVTKHLGNLKYNIWNRMKDLVSYTPLILDPNTADPDTVLSEDLSSLVPGDGKTQETPEKIEFSSVLASQGFSSGTHSWDVEVGDSPEWKLGVLAESVRNRTYQLSGLWLIDRHHGGYRAMTPSHSYTPFSVRTKPRRVRVTLDWKTDQLTFFDLDTETHIYTFNNKFTEKMFPYISTAKHLPLRVLPREIRVSVDPHTSNVS
ncbi:tripartite motif-containing protein 35-like [Salarias fasciatus]|uniref:tripartite motif-containing protein 35-like n=1 Tax=Salarias fasciatus TaxID=181472 RepID=UPI001176915B|nr:tripartite motif-containing protein 35-like [Salarias fasciatus]